MARASKKIPSHPPREARFRHLVDSIEDYAIYMLDRQGHVATWNRGAQKNKGYTAAQILGQHFRMFFTPEEKADRVPEARLAEAEQNGRSVGEGWRVRKNGERFWASFVITAMRDQRGELVGFAKVTRDLSERKRFEDEMREMERNLRLERDRLTAAAETSLDALWICEAIRDASGKIEDFGYAFMNSNVEKIVAIPRATLMQGTMNTMLPLNRSMGFFDRYCEVVETGHPMVCEVPIHDKDVHSSWIHVQAVKVGDGVAVTVSDITERKEKDLRLARSAEFLQSILASSPFATIVTDLDGTITSVNPAAERMLWYRKEELIGLESPLILLDQRGLMERAHALSGELHVKIKPGPDVLTAKPKRGLIEESEWQMVRRDGSKFDAQITVSALTGQNAESVGFVLIAHDISERKRREEYISHLAHHDSLTGLPTRILLHDRLKVALAHADRYGGKVTLLMVDLDNFKRVNDLMGHHVGDELLSMVAQRLKKSVRASDTVARMGGDEFVVLLDNSQSAEDVVKIANKIVDDVSTPFSVRGNLCSPTVSVGICTYPDHGQTAELLLRNADIAMYDAKAAGRNGHKVFDQALEAATRRSRELEANLRNALAFNEFELVYQPQVALKTGLVCGIEALLRWRSKKLGEVMPSDFIPLAEESGLIVPIGEWVLRTACREGFELQRQLERQLTIAVNVSPRQFQSSVLPQVIKLALDESNLPPSSLELEVTENILIGDSQPQLATLEQIRSFGVKVSIDDFGTGFSSMSYILRFRVDQIKIDQSFVREMTSVPENRAVTFAVIAMAKSLKIPVIAEGVETERHRDLLFAKGCQAAQGYFYAKPVPFRELSAMIEEIERLGVSRGEITELSKSNRTARSPRVQ